MSRAHLHSHRPILVDDDCRICRAIAHDDAVARAAVRARAARRRKAKAARLARRENRRQ